MEPTHNATADLVVIGGGILGCATAFYAAQRGLRIIVMERGHRLGGLTTQASAGGFRQQFDTPEEVGLLRDSIEIWDHFSDHVGDPTTDLRLVRNGYAWVTRQPDRALRQQSQVAHQRRLGVADTVWMSGDEARRQLPFLAPDVVGVRYRSRDGWIDPVRATIAYASASRRAGVIFARDTTVTGFTIVGDRVVGVQTNRGFVSCAYAIIAAGPFTGQIAALAGINLPISPRIRQRIVLPNAPEVPSDAPMTIDEDTGSHWRPEGAGAFILRPDPDAPTLDPTVDPPATREFYDLLLHPDSDVAVALHAPFWRAVWERQDQHWYVTAGQYSYSPDHKPLLGRTSVPNLGVNGGYSGHGIMASPAGSQLAVAHLLGEVVTNPFATDRKFASAEHRGPL